MAQDGELVIDGMLAEAIWTGRVHAAIAARAADADLERHGRRLAELIRRSGPAAPDGAP